MNYCQKIALLGLSLVALGGCTSIPREQVDRRISEWKGQPIESLIKYWGLPSKQREVDNTFYAEWINKSSEPGNTAISVGTGSHTRHSSIGIGFTLLDLGGKDDACSRLATYTKEGIVTDISWQGTNNYCYKLTPDLAEVMHNKAEKAQP